MKGVSLAHGSLFAESRASPQRGPEKGWGCIVFDRLFSRRQRYLVSDALDDYEHDFLLRECRSIAALHCVMKALGRELGELPVESVTMAMLRDYQATRRGMGRAAATVNKELAILSAALNLAAMNERIPAVPKFPRRLPNAAPRQGFLEEDDYLAIRARLPDWGKLILDFGWYSGWRRSEVLGLRREEVDLRSRQIRLHPSRSKNKDARLLPLRGFGLQAIETALAVRGQTVFTREGRQVARTTWLYTWRDAAREAGRGGMRYHDL